MSANSSQINRGQNINYAEEIVNLVKVSRLKFLLAFIQLDIYSKEIEIIAHQGKPIPSKMKRTPLIRDDGDSMVNHCPIH